MRSSLSEEPPALAVDAVEVEAVEAAAVVLVEVALVLVMVFFSDVVLFVSVFLTVLAADSGAAFLTGEVFLVGDDSAFLTGSAVFFGAVTGAFFFGAVTGAFFLVGGAFLAGGGEAFFGAGAGVALTGSGFSGSGALGAGSDEVSVVVAPPKLKLNVISFRRFSVSFSSTAMRNFSSAVTLDCK